MRLNIKEFAKACGIQDKHISTYAKRGKINIVQGFIDLDDQLNATFLEATKAKKDIVGEVVSKAPTIKPIKPKPSPQTDPEEPEPMEENEPTSLLEIEKAMQKAKLRRQINGDTKEKIIIQKLLGALVEVDVVQQLVTEVGKSITIEFRAVLDSFINQIAFKHQVDNVEVSGYRKHGVFVINKAYEDAIEKAKKKVEDIVADLEGK